ncbi:MAG: hypothetical protein DCE90_01600 [Pseudanabaena sp.]|nr:MAG: hypothetical protein DCE90_01600 [Pseudanabaena sp.]
MTTTQTMTLERERLLKLAEEYRNQGYTVTLHPNSEDLPNFLKNYRPDMIVQRGDEAVVVEVKSHTSLTFLPSQYLSSIAKAIEQHQGWRLDLVMTSSDESTPYPSKSEGSLQKQEIELRLQIAKQIANYNLESAILYSWSLVEATLRLIAEKEELSLKKFDPLYLVKYLTSEGIISRSDYQFLLNALSSRNTIAHGFKTTQLTPNTVAELIEIIEKLLEDLNSSSEAS